MSVDRAIGIPCHNPSSLCPQGRYLEHLSLRSSILRYLESDLLRFLIWLGPITVQQRHNNQDLYSNVLNHRYGYGIALAIGLDRYCPLRLELVVFLLKNLKGSSASFSLHWNFFWPRTVFWDTKIVNLALCGDVGSMKRELSRENCSIFDVLPDGFSLLHVCFCQ